jgi:hypothetical protein
MPANQKTHYYKEFSKVSVLSYFQRKWIEQEEGGREY